MIYIWIYINHRFVTDGGQANEFSVYSLPPFELSFSFPKGYPTESSPAFTISCSWLSLHNLAKLASKLEDLWKENKAEVLFTWFNFLIEDSINFLRYKTLDISHLVSDSKQTTKSKQLRMFKPAVTRGDGYYDRRAVRTYLGQDLITSLQAFSSYRQEELYKNTYFVCVVCMSSHTGSESICFSCSHSTCKACLKGYFEVQIADGNVHGLKCPEYKCPILATTEQIASVVSEETLKRYDKLVLNSVISSMTDVVFCPRVGCNSHVIPDRDSQLASCSECSFAFCSNCKFTFHGVSPCRLFRSEKDRLEIMKKYNSASPEEKSALEKLYGKQQIERAFNEYLTQNWINEYSKPCPQCDANIEKIDGCHKMTCWRCNSYFCWLCLTMLTGANPYTHFSDPRSPCYNQLFLGVDDAYPE